MADSNKYLMSASEVTEVINEAIEVYLDGLLTEGVITNEQYDSIATYRIVAHKKGFFGRMLSAISKEEGNNTLHYRFIKLFK
jgi:hypothetical protein